MTSLKARVLTGALALAGCFTGLAVLDGTAFAMTCEEVAPVIDSVTVNPDPLLLTTSYAKTITVTVAAHDEGGYDECANDFNGGNSTSGIRDVRVELNGETDYGWATTTVTQIAGDAYSGVWKATTQLDHGDGPGLWSVEVDVEDYDYNEITDEHAAYFHVRHGTKISRFSAADASVSKGDSIALRGKFTQLEVFGYEPAAVTINYYFKRAGTTTWTPMGTSRSVDYTGKFKKQFTAKASGTWAARYKGAGDYLPSNTATYTVKVH